MNPRLIQPSSANGGSSQQQADVIIRLSHSLPGDDDGTESETSGTSSDDLLKLALCPEDMVLGTPPPNPTGSGKVIGFSPPVPATINANMRPAVMEGRGPSSPSLSPGPLSLPADATDFMCTMCLEPMTEPTIANCGHTYCRACIIQLMDSDCPCRCPKCLIPWNVPKERLIPNNALNDIMTRAMARRPDMDTAMAEVFQATANTSLRPNSMAPPMNVAKLLSDVDYEKLTVNDLDRLLLVLQRRREIKATEDEACKRKLLEEFLPQLLSLKNAQLEQLRKEASLINADLMALRSAAPTSSMGISKNNKCSGVMVSTTEDFDVVDSGPRSASMEVSNPSRGKGFNGQVVGTAHYEHRSLASRKRRMHSYFDELSQIYFETRKAEGSENMMSICGPDPDATVTSAHHGDTDALDNFGTTLSQITRYNGLKPLATLSYNPDLLSGCSNVVTSIEFDKDNEFFAVGSCGKSIKLFEYTKSLGFVDSIGGISCSSSEISCNDKISSVAWSHHYKNSLASSDYDGRVSLWDVATSARVHCLMEHAERVWSVDWSRHDCRLLASGSDDSRVKLWATNMQRSVMTLTADANVHSVKFSPDSSFTVAFGSADHSIHYHDIRNPNKPLGLLRGHERSVSYVNFTSKDELVSASIDSTLKLWNLDKSSMNCTRSFSGHANSKHFVGLATDGNFVATGSEDNSLYVYHKYIQKPLFSFKLEIQRCVLEPFMPPNSCSAFVSAVSWRKGSNVLVAANSVGVITILELI